MINPKTPKKVKLDVYTKTDIARGISHIEGLPTSRSMRIVDHVIEQIVLALIAGKSVNLPKLGKLLPVYRKARKGRRPKDMQPIEIPARIRVRLIISPTLKEQLKVNSEGLQRLVPFDEDLAEELLENSAETANTFSPE